MFGGTHGNEKSRQVCSLSQQLDPLNTTNVTEITKIECQERIYTDIRVGEDCAKYRIHKTHGVALRFGSCKRVLIRLKSIRGIIEKLCLGRTHKALKPCNPLRPPGEPRIDGLVQNWPWHDNRKHFQPFLFFTSNGVMLVSRVEERDKETRVHQKRARIPRHRCALRAFRSHPRERFSVHQLCSVL